MIAERVRPPPEALGVVATVSLPRASLVMFENGGDKSSLPPNCRPSASQRSGGAFVQVEVNAACRGLRRGRRALTVSPTI